LIIFFSEKDISVLGTNLLAFGFFLGFWNVILRLIAIFRYGVVRQPTFFSISLPVINGFLWIFGWIFKGMWIECGPTTSRLDYL